MNPLIATILQRAVDLRRVAHYVSSDALRDLWRQAPYLTSVGGAIGIAAAIAVSKLFPGSSGGFDAPSRHPSARSEEHTSAARGWNTWRRNAVNAHAIGVALALVVITIVASQGVERLINRVLRPDAEEWTWIGDLILSVGLLVMTMFWARLRQARATISALDAQRIVIDTQLRIAADVQRALLPPIPEPLGGVHWYGSVESAGRVGGDYFDFLALPDGRMVVVLADISGKGIAAAIFMSNIRAIVQALVRDVSAPDEILRRLSRDVLADARAGLYATCFIALVDPARRTMTYSNAGHPPGILTGPRGVRRLGVGGPPVGLLEGATYDAETVAFGEDQIITLISDGVSEAMDVPADALPFAVASEISRASSRTPQAVCEQLLGATRGSLGPRDAENWSDDRTVVAFGVISPAPVLPRPHSVSPMPSRSAIR